MGAVDPSPEAAVLSSGLIDLKQSLNPILEEAEESNLAIKASKKRKSRPFV